MSPDENKAETQETPKEMPYEEDIPSAETIRIDDDEPEAATDKIKTAAAYNPAKGRVLGVLFAVLVIFLLLGASYSGVFESDDDDDDEALVVEAGPSSS